MITGIVVGDDAVLAKFAALPAKLRAVVADALKAEWFRVQAAVITGKLSGDPLHRRTGVLATSINVGGADTATEFIESDSELVARIGTKVRYGAIHENGGTFRIPEHVRRMNQVFGRAVPEKTVTVREHAATFPQRSFLRSTLREQAPTVRSNLEKAVAAALAG